MSIIGIDKVRLDQEAQIKAFACGGTPTVVHLLQYSSKFQILKIISSLKTPDVALSAQILNTQPLPTQLSVTPAQQYKY